jgi:hypothetical protein
LAHGPGRSQSGPAAAPRAFTVTFPAEESRWMPAARNQEQLPVTRPSHTTHGWHAIACRQCVMGLGPGDAGRTVRDLSQWNYHTRLVYRNQLCMTTLIMKDLDNSNYERSVSGWPASESSGPRPITRCHLPIPGPLALRLRRSECRQNGGP